MRVYQQIIKRNGLYLSQSGTFHWVCINLHFHQRENDMAKKEEFSKFHQLCVHQFLHELSKSLENNSKIIWITQTIQKTLSVL